MVENDEINKNLLEQLNDIPPPKLVITEANEKLLEEEFKWRNIQDNNKNSVINFGSFIVQHKGISITIISFIIAIIIIVLCVIYIPKSENKQNNTEDKQNNEQYS